MRNFKKYTLTLRDGRSWVIDRPLIMGILNVTPDSFYAGSRCDNADKIETRVRQIVAEGADMIDIGAYSTRPGAAEVSPEEEYTRLCRGMEIVHRLAPGMLTSVDTFRAGVAQDCVEQLGVDIVNDVAGGTLDAHMWETVARLQVPYIMMHMRGTPATMQQLTHYDKPVTDAVVEYLAYKIEQLHAMGVRNVIADPGFGFSKTLEQNYQMMDHLEAFHSLQVPLLVGVSRKSMIYKLLGCTPLESLNGTTVLNTMALLKGAHILRVHDVKPAVEARAIVEATLAVE